MAGAASQAGDADSSRAPGLTSGLQGFVIVHRGSLLLVPQWQCISSFVFYIFCHTCSLCRVELVVQFPARGSTQVLLCPFPDALWLWHVLYSVGPHPVSSLHIYTFVVLRAFIAGAASQAGDDADFPRAPGFTSGLQGSVIVPRGSLLLVPQWQCISSFVFYLNLSSLPDGHSIAYSGGWLYMFMIYCFYHLKCLCNNFWPPHFGWLFFLGLYKDDYLQNFECVLLITLLLWLVGRLGSRKLV